MSKRVLFSISGIEVTEKIWDSTNFDVITMDLSGTVCGWKNASRDDLKYIKGEWFDKSGREIGCVIIDNVYSDTGIGSIFERPNRIVASDVFNILEPLFGEKLVKVVYEKYGYGEEKTSAVLTCYFCDSTRKQLIVDEFYGGLWDILKNIKETPFTIYND